jgi:hypothetical protein
LNFDTKGEILVFVERIVVYPQTLHILFMGRFPSPHSEFLKGGPSPAKAAKKRRKFDLKTFLFNHLRWQDHRGRFQTRKRSLLKGDPSDSVSYIHRGNVKLTVVPERERSHNRHSE